MLYYTILYYTILYYTILYYTILYYTIVYSDIRRRASARARSRWTRPACATPARAGWPAASFAVACHRRTVLLKASVYSFGNAEETSHIFSAPQISRCTKVAAVAKLVIRKG